MNAKKFCEGKMHGHGSVLSLLCAATIFCNFSCVALPATIVGPISGPVSIVRYSSSFDSEAGLIEKIIVGPAKVVFAGAFGALYGFLNGLACDRVYWRTGFYFDNNCNFYSDPFEPFRYSALKPTLDFKRQKFWIQKEGFK